MPSLSYCFTPDCAQPPNAQAGKVCPACGASLQLHDRYRAIQVLGQSQHCKTFLAIDEQNNSTSTTLSSVSSNFISSSNLISYCVIKQFKLEPLNAATLQLRSMSQQPLSQQPTKLPIVSQAKFQDQLQDQLQGQLQSELQSELQSGFNSKLQSQLAHELCHEFQSGLWQDRYAELGQSPHLPALLDCFLEEYLYSVQAYIPGESLATLIQRVHHLSSIEVWHILNTLLGALQLMHRHNLLHGDIKPSNIILRAQSTAQSSIDRATETETVSALSLPASDILTLVDWSPFQLAIGNPEYAAPEQIQGKITFASDLYSLGITCIHLLTGMQPFLLFDANQHRWIWQDYWLKTSPAPIDYALAQVLDRMIAPELIQRFPSVAATIATINKLTHRSVAPAPPPASATWHCQQTLSGHKGLLASINAIAFSPDGTWLASGSEDKTIRVWQLATGQTQQILSEHTSPIKSVTFHPYDPALLASGSRDRTIKLWHLPTGRVIHTLVDSPHPIQSLTFSPDGTLLASGTTAKTLVLWDWQQNKVHARLEGHLLGVNAIAFHPMASSVQPILASGSSDTTVQIWDWQQSRSLQTLYGHTGAVKTIAFSPQGDLLATSGEDRTIRLWETTNWSCLQVLPGHAWRVTAIAFFPDGQQLVSSSWDKTLKIWQIPMGRNSSIANGTIPNSDGSIPGTSILYDSIPVSSKGTCVGTCTGHQDSILCLAIAPDGKTIASGSQDKTVKLWN